jgi:hypothetical protein
VQRFWSDAKIAGCLGEVGYCASEDRANRTASSLNSGG